MPSPPLSSLTLHQTLLRHPPAPCHWIAYSGGMDSHVLLHLCASLASNSICTMEFQAVHVHHGLQQAADAWAEHCANVCSGLNVPLLTIRADARAKPGESPEEVARRARYSALRKTMSKDDIVLTAQHRDDQAETLLLQLVRGAGLAGLAAMPEFAPLPPGFLLRPLLQFSRADLRAYALGNGLHWIEDPSNGDTTFDRNFLRREIIPKLEQRWPGLNKALGRTAGHCAEAQQQLGDLSKDLCRTALNADGQSLGVAALRSFRPADQRLVLREWMRMRGFRMPSQAVIGRILQEALPARPDKMPMVAWSEGEVRRYRDGLYLMSVQPLFDISTVLDWDGQGMLELPDGNGKLSVEASSGKGLARDAWRKGNISIRYRQGGERCRLPGRNGTHELKKLFQEAGIPPWLRERMPLVYIGGELAAIAGRWVCEPFAGKAGDSNISLVWHTGLE
ncbi:MAG: tRNA lysidine(34) synthetase TilS [Proteobacteria bacterium]|nr:tRNA lysidine(34) synthetase TilS [Pseudomonadota bacterium]